MGCMSWFQNHARLDRKACGLVKPSKAKVLSTTYHDESADDDEAIQLHLRQLEKECKHCKKCVVELTICGSFAKFCWKLIVLALTIVKLFSCRFF